MKKMIIMAIVAMLAAGPAFADICDDCGINESNIDLWRAIDPSGNGTLSTLDLILFTKFVQNCQGGFEMIFEEDLGYFVSTQCDVNGDGSWTGADQLIINALADYFILTGTTQVHYDDLIACLRAVILGVCP